MLALVWAAITGDFSFSNVIAGFILGLLVLFFTRRVVGVPTYTQKLGKVLNLAAFFVRELFLANLRIAYEVVTPTHHMRPGVVAIPLDVRSDAEITLLANMITLTPGTLSLDITADRSVLYLHAMYLDEDVDVFRHKIKDGFERRILEVLR
jgi:multicomponent Na+:H+ antiporter subunit E